jgi:alpha-beta hydrolase superfamily lysophospholipase
LTDFAALTPEQLQRLRRQLPPFSDDAVPSALLLDFCRDYGIDFAARWPSITHVAGHIRSGAYTLAVHRWSQADARANLLLLHGYFDHTGLFNKLVEWGLSHRCNVLIFDLPGHGLSSGEPAVIDDFGDYGRAIDDVLRAVSLPALPLWVMAQSTGAAALLEFACRYPWPFKATVLLAPLVRPANWWRVKISHTLLGSFVDSIARTFSVNSSDPAFLEFLRRDPLQSQRISLRWVGALRRWLDHLPRRDLGLGAALVIQGDADATVDWRYNVEEIRRMLPGSRVEFLHGARHQLANEAEAIRRDYLERVQSWLSQCGIRLDDSSPVEPR